MAWLSPDSSFMRGLSDLTDAMWINILMMVTSIPIVTIGASLTAAHYAARHSLIGEGHVTSNYFKAFKSNFAESSLLWLIFGLTGALLVYSWVFLRGVPSLVVKFLFSIVWVVGFEWVWALQSRFENSVGGMLKNAFVFGFSYIGYTFGLVAIDVLFSLIVVATWLYMPKGEFLLIILGYGSMVMVHVPITERVFGKYLK